MLGTTFTAGGYGATFLVSDWYRAQGGSDIDAGATLGVALVGTLVGVPVVGWFAGQLDASRLAALAALTMSAGYLLLGSGLVNLPHVAALLIGLGWGMFYIGGPMALSERITDAQRGPWFTRFSAFQMTGICGSPILLTAVIAQTGMAIQATFLLVGGMGMLAALLLGMFASREPRGHDEPSLRPWVRKLSAVAASSAIRPIAMVGLGGCVFSGIMSFQGSLVEGTDSHASTFFAVHAATVVTLRLMLARRLSMMPQLRLITVLLSCLILGIVCLLGTSFHPAFHIIAAMLTGAGYGLVYPVIQTWTINHSAPEHRHAALTWFVVAYFVGIFGFPVVGGWILVGAGKEWFILTLAAIASLELAAARLGSTGRPPAHGGR
ncbi:MFS transporter [Pinirhizobacter sp.]|jgi:MFS family permease|uniref:MFS transporter n=1 Tax=Pinirhizobacter sp. TaxID=2950432 RepID=UPI002F3F5BD4